MMTQQLYSIQEIANHLVLSQKIIRRYIASGELEAVKEGGAYRISGAAVEQFINKRRQSTQMINYDLFGNPVEEITVNTIWM